MDSKRAISAALACAGAAWAFGVAPAGAQEAEPDRASAALAAAQELLTDPNGAAVEPAGREATLVLAELARLLPRLDDEERRVARRLLARPDDGENDQYGDGYTVDEPDESPACSADSCVHWVTSTADAPDLTDVDANDIPDFVDDTLDAGDASGAVENGTLGWEEPLGDGSRGENGMGGSDRTDIYLIDTEGRYFGYASPDPGQGANNPSKRAYLVLDDDYAEFEGPALTAIEAMQVTMAHEYNHVLQFTLDARQEVWFFESTATWAEDYVYPGIDDWLGYVDSFAASSARSLDRDRGLRIYGLAVWNHYLSETMGPDVIRTAWEDSDGLTPARRAVPAYDSALGGSGPPYTPVGEAFANFAAASAEWASQPTLFPNASDLPDVRRASRLADDQVTQRRLDGLAYALYKLRPRYADDGLKLAAEGPGGVPYAIALVARTGPRTSGTVTTVDGFDENGGRSSVNLPPQSADRLTAVIVNADARVSADGHPGDGSAFQLRVRAG